MAPKRRRPQLREDSPAVLKIKSMFERGDLLGTETAKEVFDMDPLFKPFRFSTFKAKFHKIRQEMLKSSTVLNPQTSENMTPRGGENVDKEVVDIDDSIEFSPEPLPCPSIGSNEIQSSVSDDGSAFELAITWPEPMNDVKLLHKLWLTKQFDPMKDYHPKVLGFQKALKALRKTASDSVKSSCSIQLPFRVESHVLSKQILTYADQTKVYYVDLKAPDDKYFGIQFSRTSQSQSLSKPVRRLTPSQLEDFVVLKNSALENVWNETVSAGKPDWPQGTHWDQCPTATECIEAVKSSTAEFMVTFEIVGKHLLSEHSSCDQLTVHQTRDVLYQFNGGWLYNMAVNETRRLQVDRELVGLRIKGETTKLVDEALKEYTCGDSNTSQNVETMTVLIPCLVFVVPPLVLSILVLTFWDYCISHKKKWHVSKAALGATRPQIP